MNATKGAAFVMLLCAGMIVSSRASAGPIPASFYNEDVYLPPVLGAQSDFEIVFGGNQAGALTPVINPFPNGTAFVEPYNPATNTTTMVFEGNPLLAGQTYHFGYSEVGGTPVPHGFGSPDVLQQYWTPGNELLPAPTLTVGIGPPVNGAGIFLLLYAEGAFIAADSLPYFPYLNRWWSELWVPFGGLFPVNIWNFLTDDPDNDGPFLVRPLDGSDDDAPTLRLSNVEYFFSTTQIPLDQLNDANLPPTDPLWLPSGIPNGTTLGPGDSATFTVDPTPEPGSLILLSIGAAVLGGYGWRHRKQIA